MKKTLAIVLALVMVLCMVPAMGATTYQTITDKSYDLTVKQVIGLGSFNDLGSESNANSISVEYEYGNGDDTVTTGKFTDDAVMALVRVHGFHFTSNATIDSIKIDGKELDVDSSDYSAYVGAFNVSTASNGYTGLVNFPIELTKAGYTDTFTITVVSTEDDVTTTETAKITVKVVNKSSYKTAETAVITNIVAEDNQVLSAYIVGSKIYLDYVGDSSAVSGDEVTITFAKAGGAAFTEIAYANQVLDDDGDQAAFYVGSYGDKAAYGALDNSAYTYSVNNKGSLDDIIFEIETKSAFYQTKEYDVVIRTGVVETDPKGIYFAEATKTISIGQSYTPVVMGVATGKSVAAELDFGTNTSKEVIDIEDGDTVIGTQEGVAYITASYTPAGVSTTYSASSMKIVVSGYYDGNVVPPVDSAANTYKVTATTLNVRKGPGTSYAKAGTLTYGATVEVVSITNGWAKLADGTYVSAQYLRATSTSSSDATTMYVTCRSLNVRSGAGTSYSKVGSLSRNTAVEVVSVSSGWAKLSDGTYVAYKYLTL